MKALTDSIFFGIHEQVARTTDLETLRALILEHLDKQQNLRGKAVRDIAKMKTDVKYRINDHKKLLFWFYNNMQAYVGARVIESIPR